MQLHQLDYASPWPRSTSFTRAAARLHLAQPSLSRQVRLLERELGVLLFNRGPGPGPGDAHRRRRGPAAVHPPGPGRRGSHGRRGPGPERDGPWAALDRRHAQPDHPCPRPRRWSSSTPAIPGSSCWWSRPGRASWCRQLASGEVDLALVVLPVNDPLVATTPLFDDPLVLAVAPGHPLAGRATVGVADLDGLALVMFREGYDLRSVTLAACRDGRGRTAPGEPGRGDGRRPGVRGGRSRCRRRARHRAASGPPGLAPSRSPSPGSSRTVALAQRNDRALPRPAQPRRSWPTLTRSHRSGARPGR